MLWGFSLLTSYSGVNYIPYHCQWIVGIFLGTGQIESQLFLLLRYFLGFTAFYLVIFDFTPLPPLLPRYLEKVRCEPEGQFDIFHPRRDRTQRSIDNGTVYETSFCLPSLESIVVHQEILL